MLCSTHSLVDDRRAIRKAPAANRPRSNAPSNFNLRMVALGAMLASLGLSACDCGSPPPGTELPLGDGFQSLTAVDATTLTLRTTRALDPASVTTAAFQLNRFTTVPPEQLVMTAATLDEDTLVTLTTAPLLAGQTYTLDVSVLDIDGFAIEGTLNVTGVGDGPRIPIEIEVTNPIVAEEYGALFALVTVDLETGFFSEEMVEIEVSREVEAEGARYLSRLEVRVDANRTLEVGDDDDAAVDRRAYAVRIVDEFGRVASPLVLFALPTADAERTIEVELVRPPQIVTEPSTPPPEVLPDPPVDETPDDGSKMVRIVIDDRIARELSTPSLKLAFDATGGFDATFPQTLEMTRMEAPFEGFWELLVAIDVDTARVADGQTQDTFPYFAYLVEAGVEYEGLSVALVAQDEASQTVQLALGNPEWTPVTFRVDVSGAFLVPDGSEKGHYPNEAVFLTGEWLTAVDALGNNCGDAFSGGEQPCLRMREDAAHAGVWTRTIWLPPGRPYGWKVVRCDALDGCGPLNQVVASSGRAFATVMKNLVTDNVDAFADAEVGLVDPLDLANTPAAGDVYDYSSAEVYVGNAEGAETDPPGTPDGAQMFKQEAPDLVVVVAEDTIVTRVFHVGTWRDVNLGRTPAQIVDDATPLQLGVYDYDDGFIGRYPPSRADP